jgi:hypothetical protein
MNRLDAEFRRWKHEYQVNRLNSEYFELLPGEYSRTCKCKLCGRQYRISQKSYMSKHEFEHMWFAKQCEIMKPGTIWMLRMTPVVSREIEILEHDEKRGWLVQRSRPIFGHKKWWVRVPKRFLYRLGEKEKQHVGI